MRPSSALRLAAYAILADNDEDDDEDDNNDEVVAIALLALAEHWRKQETAAAATRRSRKWGRRGPYDRIKLREFLDLLLDGFTDRLFKAWLRMDRASFWHLHNLIKADDIFLSKGRRPQRPVKYQLAAYLIKFGSTSSIKVASALGIAEGTAYKYHFRVCEAIRRLRSAHIAWPGPQRREFLSREMEDYGFPGCIGMVDGSLVRLKEKPYKNGANYWCRKKCYALNIQAVTDHRGIFTQYELGWPGSVHDATLFKQSLLWQRRPDYFQPHEYILADKGYPLTKHTIRPFADYDLTNDPDEAATRKTWNQRLSTLRVSVEHAFGRLKGRFQVFRRFPGRRIPQVCAFIESLLIVHNILTELGDDPLDVEGWNGEEEEDEMAEDGLVEGARNRRERLSEQALYQAGILRRKHLLDLPYRSV